MKICAIAAMDKNRCIGKDGTIPWRLKADMTWFKVLTSDHVVIMGRKTWDSLPIKPLPTRYNIIITKNPNLISETENIFATDNPSTALSIAMFRARRQRQEKIFIIGGESIYNLYLDQINTHYLTMVDAKIDDGDAFYPNFNVNAFTSAIIATQEPDSKNEFAFKLFEFERKEVLGTEKRKIFSL